MLALLNEGISLKNKREIFTMTQVKRALFLIIGFLFFLTPSFGQDIKYTCDPACSSGEYCNTEKATCVKKCPFGKWKCGSGASAVCCPMGHGCHDGKCCLSCGNQGCCEENATCINQTCVPSAPQDREVLSPRHP